MSENTEEFRCVETLDVKEYNNFRDLVGWGALPEDEAQTGIDYSAFILSCKKGNTTVGVARMLWDHGYIAYLSDVIVHPDYQRCGVGKMMVDYLTKKLRSQMKPGWKTKICLMAAFGKEEFYEKQGFIQRPNERCGPGMELWLKDE